MNARRDKIDMKQVLSTKINTYYMYMLGVC